MTGAKLLYHNNTNCDANITVAIPTFGRSELIKQTLHSVLNQLGTVKYKLVVVSNDSEDSDCSEIIKILNQSKDIDSKVFRNLINVGMIENWNKCFEFANTEYVIFLHDDDLLANDALITYDREMHKWDAVSSSTQLIGNKRYSTLLYKLRNKLNQFYQFRRSLGIKLNLKNALIRCPITTSGTIFRKAVFLELGGFREDIFPGSDYEFNLRLVSRFNVFQLKNKLVKYRIHKNASHSEEVIKKSSLAYHKIRIQCYELLYSHSNSSFKKIIIKNILNYIFRLESSTNNYKLEINTCKSVIKGFKFRIEVQLLKFLKLIIITIR